MFVVYYFCTIYIFKTRLKKPSVFSVIQWFYFVKRANIKNISVHIIRAKFVLWNVGSQNIVVPTLIETGSEWRRVHPDGVVQSWPLQLCCYWQLIERMKSYSRFDHQLMLIIGGMRKSTILRWRIRVQLCYFCSGYEIYD